MYWIPKKPTSRVHIGVINLETAVPKKFVEKVPRAQATQFAEIFVKTKTCSNSPLSLAAAKKASRLGSDFSGSPFPNSRDRDSVFFTKAKKCKFSSRFVCFC